MNWLGSILLAICAIPLAIDAIKGRDTKINPWFYWSWFVGEILLALSYYNEPALLVNYSVNIICLVIVGVKNGNLYIQK